MLSHIDNDPLQSLIKAALRSEQGRKKINEEVSGYYLALEIGRTYDGMMIDYAHVRNAQELLDQAAAFGMDVGEYAQVKAL